MNIDDFQRLGQWMAKAPRSASSMTMVSIAMGARSGSFVGPSGSKGFAGCADLIDAFPDMAKELPTIAALVPGFAVLLPHWEELMEIHRESRNENSGLIGGHASRLNRRIQELLRPLRRGE